MSDRLRAKLAMHLVAAARRLLQMSTTGHDGDYSKCIYCGATGCDTATAEHAPDCPTQTGVFAVTLQEMWPAGPPMCDRCDTTLWPGDTYSHIRVPSDAGETFPVYEVSCTGCALLAEIEAA
ncbi:MAG TPA: hypothetical protein VEW07_02260 [Solirubrobacterales bacterium]|nr:hypothetical protein [Solirubrobacterales bacterium]